MEPLLFMPLEFMNTLIHYCWQFGHNFQWLSHRCSNLFTRVIGQDRVSLVWITTSTRWITMKEWTFLNWFLFRTILCLRLIPIINQHMIRSMMPFQEHIQLKMKKFYVQLPSLSSELGHKSSTTSTKSILIGKGCGLSHFQTILNQSCFRVLGFFRTFHLHPLHLHTRLWKSHVVIELAPGKISVLIFTLVSIVENIVIIQIGVPVTRLLQERIFTLDGLLLGNVH